MLSFRSVGAALAVLLIFGCVASAEILDSQAGLDTCVFQAANGLPAIGSPPDCDTYKTIPIATNPAWQPDNAPNPPVWISYAHTGQGEANFQPYGGNTINDVVFQVFQPIGAGNNFFHLQVWADDTAGVYLDGVQLKAPVFTQSTCSGQPIGCLPQDVGTFDMALNPATAHELRFDVYQVGTGLNSTVNPMGLLYTGYAVPEPGSVMLFGTLLLGVAGLVRRKLS